MNKLITKVVGVSLGLTMALGVGVAAVTSRRDAVPVRAAGPIEITATNCGWSTSQGKQTGSSVSGITVSTSKGAVGTANGVTSFRNYENATLTVSSTVGNITQAVFTCTASGTSKYGPGTMSLSNGSTGSYSYSGKEGTWTGDATSFKLTGSAQSRIVSLSVTYTAAEIKEATTLTITASPTTVYAGDKITVRGDLTGGSGAYEKTIGWTSDNTTVIGNPENSEDGESFVITPNSVASQTTITLTGTVVSPGSATSSTTLTVKPARTLQTISVSGDMSNKTYNKGASWDYSGLSLVGNYSDGSVETLGTFPDLITAGTLTFTSNPDKAIFGATSLSLSDISYNGKTVAGGHTITGIVVNNDTVDVLTVSSLGLSGTYSDWSNKTLTSTAKYAGNSATSSGAIQIRGSKNSGIVTTASAGVVSKIAFEWSESTSGGRIVNIFGKDTAYSGASDLFDSNKQGTLLGTIVYGTSTELNIPSLNRTSYIGITVGTDNAAYLSSISITWTDSEPIVTELTLSPSAEQTLKVGKRQTFTVNVTGKHLTGFETAAITYDPVELTSSAITLSASSVLANGGTFTLDAVTADACGTLKVTCLGVDSNEVDIYTEAAKELSSLTVTANGTTGYITGKAFSKTGFVITATYSDATTSTVQDTATWNILRNSSLLPIDSVLAEGDVIRVTYEEGGTTKTTDIALTIIESIADITGSYEGNKTVSKATSDLGIADATEITDVTFSDSVKINGDKGTNANNPPKYYNNGNNIRAYAGNTITISSDKAISKIVLKMSTGYVGEVTVNTGTYSLSELTGTWTGSATSVTFSTSAAWRFENITVTYLGTVTGNISNEYYDAQRVVLKFANDLYGTLDTVCVAANYESADFIAAWDLVAEKFNDYFVDNTENLDSTNMMIAKQLLSGAAANYSGDTLQKAMARYDFIISNSDLTAFMVDGTTPLRSVNGGSGLMNNIFNNNGSTAALIVIVSLVSVTAIGGYSFVRKSKEQ